MWEIYYFIHGYEQVHGLPKNVYSKCTVAQMLCILSQWRVFEL